MTCYNKCSHEQEILDRLANIENKDLHTVQTVNGVYGPFVTLEIPDVTFLTDQVEQNKEDITTLNTDLDTTNDNVAGLTYVEEILSYEATPTTFKARVKMRDDTVVEMVLPPVSELDVGVMTPSAYTQVWTNKAQIEQMLLGTSIPTGDLGMATPTQLQLTTLWTTTMARDPADGDRVMNTYNNVVWLFATGLWYAISSASTPQATNSTLGTVKGSTADGKAQVELDGTLSVNGWDATQENILSKIPKTDIVTSIGASPSDVKVPSEKASKNALDLKNDKSVSVSNITILNTNWIANTDSADLYALGYLYQYTIPVPGVSAAMIPTVVPAYAVAISGNLWSRCQSVTGGITIYSRSNEEITILTALGQVI